MTLTGKIRDKRVLIDTPEKLEKLRREARKRREKALDWVLAIDL